MSQENVEVVRQLYDAVTRRDLHAALDLIHFDFEGTARVVEVEGSVYRGRDGARSMVEEIWSAFTNWRPGVASASSVGDAVVVEFRLAGRGVGSGVDIAQTTWQVVRLRDGQIIWMHGYATEREALEAVGLAE